MKLFGCLSFDVTVLAFDVLGRTSASIVYLREKSVIKGNFPTKYRHLKSKFGSIFFISKQIDLNLLPL